MKEKLKSNLLTGAKMYGINIVLGRESHEQKNGAKNSAGKVNFICLYSMLHGSHITHSKWAETFWYSFSFKPIATCAE